MTDPGGGHGWRSAPYLPRRHTGVFGLGRIAERGELADRRPVAVLLLPEPLEAFWLRDRAEDLLTAPGVVAVDPARVSYRGLARLPEPVVSGLAAGQARRLSFPGAPRAVVIFHPLQYPLARAVISQHLDAELWYAWWTQQPDERIPRRLRTRQEELDQMASMRAKLRFEVEEAPGALAHELNLALWERLERLGVETGRLGSERPDVIRAWRGGP
jgi:hypothetical protein